MTPPGLISFIQNHVPVLLAGDYTLTPTFHVTATNPDGSAAQATSAPALEFAVYGDRFALDATLIESVYPPPNSTGEFDNVLPHAVLTRPSLPWERTASADGNARPDTEGNVAPWLALLLFDETELDHITASTQTVAALVPPTKQHPQGSLPDGTVSSLSVSAAVLDDWEHLDDPCRLLDVPAELFSALAPTADDLKWLAHARRKTVPGASPNDPEVTTDHAVVIGNRLPAAGHTSTVFLVSLEQLSDHLPDDEGGRAAALTDATCVRLVVLSSWKITAVSESQTFAELLEGLNTSDEDPKAAVLRLPQGAPESGAADATVTDAITRGYVPLPHTTRKGDVTVSWYRGPLTPHAVPFTALAGSQLPAASADGVTAYDSDTGMFDASLAVAWQLGRLLALADRRFATGLYAFKRERRPARPPSRSRLVADVTDVLHRIAGGAP